MDLRLLAPLPVYPIEVSVVRPAKARVQHKLFLQISHHLTHPGQSWNFDSGNDGADPQTNGNDGD